MRISIRGITLWTVTIASALSFWLLFPGTVSAGNKVDICHYQEENDSWKLLSLPQPAADAHLANHDDAEPGSETSQSGTELDGDCVEVVVTCPCEGLTVGDTTWAEGFPVTQCVLFPGDFLRLLIDIGSFEALGVQFVSSECLIDSGDANPLLLPVDAEQRAACETSLRAIASAAGVNCPE